MSNCNELIRSDPDNSREGLGQCHVPACFVKTETFFIAVEKKLKAAQELSENFEVGSLVEKYCLPVIFCSRIQGKFRHLVVQ